MMVDVTKKGATTEAKAAVDPCASPSIFFFHPRLPYVAAQVQRVLCGVVLRFRYLSEKSRLCAWLCGCRVCTLRRSFSGCAVVMLGLRTRLAAAVPAALRRVPRSYTRTHVRAVTAVVRARCALRRFGSAGLCGCDIHAQS